ncbi:MAG: hypothetical protein ACFFKA_02200 [Candidatus Thorarchaeota archaeon]
MNKKRISILILLALAFSAFPLTLFMIVSAKPVFVAPNYEPVSLESGLAGKADMPVFTSEDFYAASSSTGELHASTPPVGTTVYDWYVNAISGSPDLTLRAVGDFVEVWVQDDLSFPEGDPRNDQPWTWQITDEMVQYLADEFDNAIYASVAGYYGAPADRDGTGTIFQAIGWPSFTYDWIETTNPYNPQRVILKIINYRDANYYDPTYPSYVAGFFSSTYTSYYNRNMVHLDSWAWWQRLGEEGRSWLPEHPELTVNRPNLYESTLAHEFQHNIHRDYVVDPETFMNEACSLFAEPLAGYEIDAGQIEWFLATPDNSLTVWGDQGDINILADYGAAFLWALYLTDHYGLDFMGRYVQRGGNGIEGINALLPTGVTFDDVFHDWRIANLVQANYGKYGYQLDELKATYNPDAQLNFDDLEPLHVNEVSGKKVPWTNAGEAFGETFTLGTSSVPEGYATGVFDLGPYSSDYLYFPDLRGLSSFMFDGDDTAVYGWTYDEYWGEWWSGAENLANALLITNPYTVQANDILSVPSWYDIEDYWDFGFIQFSTDGGETWTSMSNEWTTSDHEPDAHLAIVAQLPGITGNSENDYRTLEFDLDNFITPSTEVIFGFRYMTDWNTLHAGWYIVGAFVGSTELDLIPVYPEADFQVTVVQKAMLPSGSGWNIVYDMRHHNDATETGLAFIHAMKWENVYVIVSPINEFGWTDYSFKESRIGSGR